MRWEVDYFRRLCLCHRYVGVHGAEIRVSGSEGLAHRSGPGWNRDMDVARNPPRCSDQTPLGETLTVYGVESNALSSEDSALERTGTAPMTIRREFPVALAQSSDLSTQESMKGIPIFGERVPTSGAWESDSLAAIEAGYASIRTGGPVSPPALGSTF